MPRGKGRPPRQWPRRPHPPPGRSPGTVTPAITFHGGFTLSDEAKNTASRQSRGDRDAKLRERPVTFISAGPTAPLEDLPRPFDGIPPPATLEAAEEHGQLAQSSIQDSGALAEDAPDDRGSDGASLQRKAELSLRDHSPPNKQRPSPEHLLPLASSLPGSGSRGGPSSDGHNSDSSAEIIVFKGRTGGKAAPIRSEEPSSTAVLDTKQEVHENRPPNRPDSQQPSSLRLVEAGDDRDPMADYLENIATSGNMDGLSFTLRELGDPDSFMSLPAPDMTISSAASPASEQASDGSSDDDANSDGDDDDDKSQKSEAESTEANENDVERDADVDDETLARLLAKQEELGLGGDELLSFSGLCLSAGSLHSRHGDAPFVNAKKKGRRQTGPSRGPGLTAAAVADAFDDLDLMEWGPPKSRKKGGPRHAAPDFDVSDSELEAVLTGAWRKDREKKSERKREREKARARGLLRKGAGPEDLRVKYTTALTFDDIKAELRAFLLSSDESLAFPPLDAAARKTVHHLANKFKVKSKSSGSGDQRRPVLYRTKATLKYSETHFENMTGRSRQYFPRLDVRSNFGSRPQPGGRGGGSGATYRDGDVVGAAAPELGEGNRGRAMLQKMGWSTGMALGATDNKGILQPVAQVVKRSKAGLG